jgi:hypothetical protein
MTKPQLAALIDEGLQLREEIAVREKRLKDIDKALKAHAESKPDQHVKLKDEEREGTRLLITGSKLIVPVVFTSDLIRQSIADNSEDLPEIRTLAAGRLDDFYARTVSFEAVHMKSGKFDGKAFRAAARELLPDPEAFISACVRRNKEGIPVSQSKVSWDEAEAA